eukprot:CAMPEP_0184397588 /NCGR_PEP_ID=MMETSP0007-20130409/61300_1 /TAXON_ID=97485 /ORGANISM="Prymnesium parvum, Strain Texoma1" /LENGTH=93 /DNA_ID=CAMNT_0026751103 /DNA_START=121 /DNA_END=399 /DNA_ORIENTATION=-
MGGLFIFERFFSTLSVAHLSHPASATRIHEIRVSAGALQPQRNSPCTTSVREGQGSRRTPPSEVCSPDSVRCAPRGAAASSPSSSGCAATSPV